MIRLRIGKARSDHLSLHCVYRNSRLLCFSYLQKKLTQGNAEQSRQIANGNDIWDENVLRFLEQLDLGGINDFGLFRFRLRFDSFLGMESGIQVSV